MTEDIQSINEINLMKLQIEVRLTWGQKYEGKNEMMTECIMKSEWVELRLLDWMSR